MRQYKPIWLKRKTNYLSLDIFIPKSNIALEYQGGQHFYPVNIFGGEEGFKYQMERDEIKRLKCIENNVKLFYFTYTPKDIPVNYPHKVYTDEQDLIEAINNHIIENKIAA